MKPQHTPGPWRKFGVGAGGTENAGLRRIAAGNNEFVAWCEEHHADFIVRACNSHYALLEACEKMLEAYAPRAQQTAETSGESSLHSAVQAARAAIAKAKGQL